MMKLYGFFRSGTSHRLRIALALKGLPFETVPVDLRKEAHLGDAYRSINPQGLVPALVDGPLVLAQSPALLEWLGTPTPTPRSCPLIRCRAPVCGRSPPLLAVTFTR